jgi:hypothetical protein
MRFEKARSYGFVFLVLFLVLSIAFAVQQQGIVGTPQYNATYEQQDLPAIIIDGLGTVANTVMPFTPLILLALLIVLLV